MADPQPQAPTRPKLGEIARDLHGMAGIGAISKSYTDTLLENPDSILAARGRDLALYEEMLRDDQVKSTFQQRRAAVTSCEWDVEPASESAPDQGAAEFIRAQLQGLVWDEITDQMLYGVYFGYAVAELMYVNDGAQIGIDAIRVRNRSRFQFDLDYRLRLVDDLTPQGKLMPERKFWTFSTGASFTDNPYGLGLAHSLYWPVFFKRSDIKFWLIFLEKFGMPTTAGRLPGGVIDDPSSQQKALAALQAIQTDSAVVIPEDMTIELIEAARSGTADYTALYERMDKAISKVVLSQTMTTDDGSSRSQAEVHQGVADHVIKTDADLLCESFNRGPVRWLTAWNFPSAQPPRVWRHTEPAEDLQVRAERDNKIFALGYAPTEQYIEETYGPGWEKKAEPELPPEDPKGPLPAEFTEISELALKRAGHRADQQALVHGAERLATQYHELYGKRVEQILGYLEETDDLDTFRQRLTDMLADLPAPTAVEKVRDATWYARLMGLDRGRG